MTSAAPAAAASPAKTRHLTLAGNSGLAFSRQEPGPAWIFNIFTSDINGENVRRVTSGPHNEWPVAWSPDGRKLAFMSDRGGGWDLYSVNADGDNLVRLTMTPGDCNGFADWSPDGRRLVYDNACDTTPQPARALFVVNANGSGTRNVTPPNFYGSKMGSWSPDGKYIVFSSWKNDEQEDLHVIRPNGTYVGQLTDDEAYDRQPDWGTNGKIAWASYSEETDYDILVMNADGSRVKRITNSSQRETWPSWSPDYSKILFSSEASGPNIINADGTQQHPVRRLSDVGGAIWSPWLL